MAVKIALRRDTLLHLIITNSGNETLRLWHVNTATDFDLNVRDAAGHGVTPTVDRELGVTPHHPLFLKPGETFSEAAKISEWGYHLKPGRYRLVACLGPGWTHKVFSNPIRIDAR